MKSTKFDDQYKRVVTLLGRRRIFAALRLMIDMCSEYPALALFRPQLERLSETYGYLARFTIECYDDPTRSKMLADIVWSARGLLRAMQRSLRSVDNPTLYYSTLRTARYSNASPALPEVLAALRKDSSELSLARLGTMPPEVTARLRGRLQQRAQEVFMTLWTTFPLTDDDVAAIRALIIDKVADNSTKALVAGALFMGQREMPDIKRLELLLDIYGECEPEVALRALVYLLISLAEVDPDHSRRLAPRIEALAEQEQWRNDVGLVFRQFLNTRDTERINRKITDEILPSMKDLGREMKKHAPDGVMSESDIFESEEIMSMIENSSFAQKMKEMNDIQQQGGDVMLPTFTQLKGFTFFRPMANWFLPFDPDRTEVSEALSRMPGLADILTGLPSLCDNDLYSMVFAMERMPIKQQEMFASQLNQASEQIAMLRAAALGGADSTRAAVVMRTAQNLYRFFTLYERKKEFSNPFTSAMNLMGVDLLRSSLKQDELVEHAARFYYTHGYYAEALPLLLRLENGVSDDKAAGVYFSIGDCYYRAGDFENALTYFQRSELFDDKNRDTLLRLALVNRRLDNHKKAVAYFREAIRLTSDPAQRRDTELLLAAELVDSERYLEALDIFYRLDFETPLDDPRHLRKLALAELKEHKYDKSARTTGRITQLSASDLLTLARAEMGQRNYDGAANTLSRLIRDHRDADALLTDEFATEVAADIADGKLTKDIVNIIIDEASERARR